MTEISPATTDNTRQQLLDYIIKHAIIPGKVQLSSGKIANYYIDLRAVTLQHKAGALIGILLRELLADWNFTAAGGLTMGADPIACAIMHAPGRAIDAFVVRKEVKTHGLSRRIEGPSIAGKKVVVLEDSATTGDSVLKAAEAVAVAGAQIVGIAAVVDRNTGAAQKITAAGYQYRSLFELADWG